jgi:hypothetical protein
MTVLLPKETPDGQGQQQPSFAIAGLGRWGGLLNNPEFSKLDPFVQSTILQEEINKAQEERERPLLKEFFDLERQRAREAQKMGFESLVAGGLVKSLYDLPGKIVQARQMYGPETARGFTAGMQVAPTMGQIPRYFS